MTFSVNRPSYIYVLRDAKGTSEGGGKVRSPAPRRRGRGCHVPRKGERRGDLGRAQCRRSKRPLLAAGHGLPAGGGGGGGGGGSREEASSGS